MTSFVISFRVAAFRFFVNFLELNNFDVMKCAGVSPAQRDWGGGKAENRGGKVLTVNYCSNLKIK